MFSRIVIKWIKNRYGLYSIEDLTIGGHCGCCGSLIENEIVPKIWPYSICEKCLNLGE